MDEKKKKMKTSLVAQYMSCARYIYENYMCFLPYVRMDPHNNTKKSDMKTCISYNIFLIKRTASNASPMHDIYAHDNAHISGT